MKTIYEGSLHCRFSVIKDTKAIAYILAPTELDTDFLLKWAHDNECNIAVIYGMDWDNDLTPWPEPGVMPNDPPFKGNASQFLDYLMHETIPTIEKAMGYTIDPQRNLVGVSLSGLFALWAWMQNDYFHNISCISASLWYIGFVDWLQGWKIPPKTGHAFFTLGKQEYHSPNKLFNTVGSATAQVIDILKGANISTKFEVVPGDHYANIEPRLTLALNATLDKD